MIGIEYRLKTFISPKDGRCLLVDTSAGLSLGVLPGLENYPSAVRAILPQANGVVCSPGQIGRLGPLQKTDAALLVRMDWNNTLRKSDFVLPSAHPQRLPILTTQDALDLGAEAMISTFLLGFEEEVEAACLRSTVELALEGKRLGLPLVIEIQTTGSRVSLPGKAVELGASYALEGGADVIVVPYPGKSSLKTISQFVSVPWLLCPSSLQNARVELEEALGIGATGLWLGHAIFAEHNLPGLLDEFNRLLHPEIAAER